LILLGGEAEVVDDLFCCSVSGTSLVCRASLLSVFSRDSFLTASALEIVRVLRDDSNKGHGRAASDSPLASAFSRD